MNRVDDELSQRNEDDENQVPRAVSYRELKRELRLRQRRNFNMTSRKLTGAPGTHRRNNNRTGS